MNSDVLLARALQQLKQATLQGELVWKSATLGTHENDDTSLPVQFVHCYKATYANKYFWIYVDKQDKVHLVHSFSEETSTSNMSISGKDIDDLMRVVAAGRVAIKPLNNKDSADTTDEAYKSSKQQIADIECLVKLAFVFSAASLAVAVCACLSA